MKSFAKLALMYTTIMMLMTGHGLALSRLGAPATRDTNNTYVMCTYDFDQPTGAHKASDSALPWDWAAPSILHFRERLKLERKYKPLITKGSISMEVEDNLLSVPQSLVMSTLLSLLDSGGKCFDDQSLEWYLVEGSLIGWLRFQSFIPWDEDIDFMMPTYDRVKLGEWFRAANESNFVDGSNVVAMQDPNNPNFIGLVSGTDSVSKILWVDLDTEVALDGCFDGGCTDVIVDFSVPTSNIQFGGVKANVPTDIWGGHGLDKQTGVDKGQKVVSMSSVSYSECTFYTCAQEAPSTSGAGSLSDPKQGPYHFQSTGDDGHFVCSVPRDYQACMETKREDVMVEQCDGGQ